MSPTSHEHLKLPKLDRPLRSFRAQLEAVAKPAWLLRCKRKQVISRFVTHFGGTTPFAPRGDGWPECGEHRQPMQFIFQVDFTDFQGVGTFANRGLLQFFICHACGLLPQDSFRWRCRWYPEFHRDESQSIPQMDAPELPIDTIGPYAVRPIPFLSVPAPYAFGHPISADQFNERVNDDDECLWYLYANTDGFCLEADMYSRVGGYPPWIQPNDETPSCPVCGQRAAFVAALGGEDNKFEWGDDGYWYMFACKATAGCPGLTMPLMAFQCH